MVDEDGNENGDEKRMILVHSSSTSIRSGKEEKSGLC